MLKGKTAAALTCCLVIGTAGTWAAYSYAVPAIPLLLISSASYDRAKLNEPQTSNIDAKGDRLPVATVSARYEAAIPEQPPAPTPAAFSLASADSRTIELPKRSVDPKIDVKPEAKAEPKAAPKAEPRKAAAQEKPKKAEPQRLLLDDGQISALRTRLKLTPTQEEFWPAVEVTLRNVVRQHARKTTRKNEHAAPPQIDVNSPEVQQLVSAAVPLIMRMNEEQKREVRQLARIIGLDTVASRI